MLQAQLVIFFIKYFLHLVFEISILLKKMQPDIIHRDIPYIHKCLFITAKYKHFTLYSLNNAKLHMTLFISRMLESIRGHKSNVLLANLITLGCELNGENE